MVQHRPFVITKYMPDFAGVVIDKGRLQLLDSLGSGAYGKVYLAVDRTSSKTKRKYYAVKCLCKLTPGSRQEQFQKRELMIQSMVHHHPNIVTLHKVVHGWFFVYVVLDFCAGGDLFTAITERKVFQRNDELVKRVFVQLIDAVQCCHQRGVSHRDIKPENILVSEDGARIFLADFGLSTWDDFSTEFGFGSPHYMSPECIGKGPYKSCPFSTRISDIWSLGVILTNMISGRNPWRYAIFEDEGYAAYLCDDDFLWKGLPISKGANEILKEIFVEPPRRISLSKLREDILALDTFFSTEEDSKVVDTLARHQVNGNAQADGVRSGSGNSSLSSDEYYKFRSPQVETPEIAVLVPANHDGPSNCPTTAKETNSGSSGSGQESEGPITPATKPVDPKIHIPDIEDEMRGLTLNTHVSGASDILSKIKKPFAKSTHMFRMVVTRFAGLSTKEAL